MNLPPVFRRGGFSVLALAAFATFALPGGRLKADANFDSIAQEILGIFNRSKNAVVKIEAADQHGTLCGSGFFIDPNGTIYTAYTIGGESHDIVVSVGDKKFPATRLIGDSRSGIAILKVDAQTPYLTLGKTDTLGMASPVMTIGYPMDFPVTPNFGIVGGFNIKHLDRYFSTTHIRANVPVQRGEGGSPLLNMKGEVIGVLISGIDNGAGCFVLPIEAAEKLRNDFMRFGELRPGWLGIGLKDISMPTGGSAAQINQLVEDAPADKGGLKKGDIVLEVAGKKIGSLGDMLNASYYFTSGDEIPVTVSRDSQTITVKLRAADHPSLHHEIADSPSTQGMPLPQPEITFSPER
jgi:serine protease Do